MARQLVSKRIKLYGLSYLRKHLPGSLIGYPDFILQLICRNPDLKETNRTYPLRDRRSRFFKDGTGRLCKLIFTASALVFKTVFLPKPPNNWAATSGASNAAWPANFIKKLATFAFVSNIESQSFS